MSGSVQIRPYDEALSEELWHLLTEADPDEAAVRAYLRQSEILVADRQDNIVGVAVLQKSGGNHVLKNLAVQQAFRRQGIAKLLISEAKKRAGKLGAEELEVGTGNSSLSQLALYQKCGFRISHIEKDFFKSYPEPIYENGIRCLDMIILKAPL